MLIEINDVDGINALRWVRGESHIRIRSEALKDRGLLPHALRYAIFALRPGGTLELSDTGRVDERLCAYDFTFNQCCLVAARFLHRDVELIEVDTSTRSARYMRTRPMPPPGWSAGVVYSGAPGEISQIERCVAALKAQPELAAEDQVLVCGPAHAAAAIAHLPVKYIPYDPPEGRFLIGAKKNALMAAMTAPRLLLLHARIELDKGALTKMPAEFDLTTPAIRVNTGGRWHPYLDLHLLRDSDPARMFHGPQYPTPRSRSDYLLELSRAWSVIDGGCFAVWRDVALDQPLNRLLAWGEAEDVEWCLRLHHNGYLVDLNPYSGAISATSKYRRAPLPFADHFVRSAAVKVRQSWAAAIKLLR